MSRMLRVLSLCSLALSMLALSGCGEEAKPTTPTTFCTAGKLTCEGNYVATCVGGKAYELQFCGAGKYCSAGECKATVCPRGQVTCSGSDVMRCPEDGASEPVKVATCKKTEQCKDGACVPNVCPSKGAAFCGNATLFLCDDNNIVQTTSCGADKVCDVAAKSCVARACEPTSAKCKDAKTAQTCNVTGTGYTDKVCGSGQGCFDGVCHMILSGSSGVTDAGSTQVSDATSGGDGVSIGTGDTLTKPKKDVEVQAPDVFKVTISKTKTPGSGDGPTSFDFASASYSKSTQMVTISGDKDLYKIELQLGKMEEFTTGLFTQVGGEGPDSKILVNDGTQDQATVQWVYESVDYDVEITEFGDIGSGRILGTFSAELINTIDKKTPLYLLDGTFDIARQ